MLVLNGTFHHLPKETGLQGLQPGLKLSSSLEETEASGPLISLRSKSGVDSWGRRVENSNTLKWVIMLSWKSLFTIIFRVKNNLKLTTMFISKKHVKSSKQIKRTFFQRWKVLTEGSILDFSIEKKSLFMI